MTALTYEIPSALDLKIDAVRDATNKALLLCTEKQVKFFHRIHDGAPWRGWANCPDKNLDESYELIRRTVAENAKKGAA